MSFIPLAPADPEAVMGSLRVTLANNVHTSEHAVGVINNAASDIAQHGIACANASLLSTLQLQQSLLSSRTIRDAWSAFSDHGDRLSDAYFKFIGECFASRHRALDRLHMEDGHVGES